MFFVVVVVVVVFLPKWQCGSQKLPQGNPNKLIITNRSFTVVEQEVALSSKHQYQRTLLVLEMYLVCLTLTTVQATMVLFQRMK